MDRDLADHRRGFMVESRLAKMEEKDKLEQGRKNLGVRKDER